jgi:hypothetical protein
LSHAFPTISTYAAAASNARSTIERFNRRACPGKDHFHPGISPNQRKQKEIDKQKLLAQNMHKRLFKQIFIEDT